MVVSADNSGPPEEKKEPWQMKVKSLTDGIRYIYENEEFSDIKFNVGGRTFKGHRVILGARSQKFAKMLLIPNPPIEINDGSSKIGFEILWRFIYTDELGTTDQNDILEAYRVAVNFEQKELTEKCEEFIANMEITVDNVCTILNQVPDIDLLRGRCLQFISQNNVDVLESADFLKVAPNILQDIFTHNCLEDVPVLVLQRNIMRWGFNQFVKIEDYGLVRELLMNIRILGKLKIHKLTAMDLADFDYQYPKLLTPEEYREFNQHCFRPTLPVPEWCAKDD